MEVQIKAKDYKVSPGLREFIQERVDKLDRFIGRPSEAKLELTHEHPRTCGERLTAQLTVAAGRSILRAEEQHADVRRAIDRLRSYGDWPLSEARLATTRPQNGGRPQIVLEEAGRTSLLTDRGWQQLAVTPETEDVRLRLRAARQAPSVST